MKPVICPSYDLGLDIINSPGFARHPLWELGLLDVGVEAVEHGKDLWVDICLTVESSDHHKVSLNIIKLIYWNRYS